MRKVDEDQKWAEVSKIKLRFQIALLRLDVLERRELP